MIEELVCCGHTKIKSVSWTNEHHSTSSKFMCLDCNTDFVPLTDSIRKFIASQQRDLFKLQI